MSNGTKRGRELRLKAIKEALTEYVTGKYSGPEAGHILRDNGCDPAEVAALLRSAPKTIKKRTKPAFKGEELPAFDLVGGTGYGLTK